jgi:hypothetical protein
VTVHSRGVTQKHAGCPPRQHGQPQTSRHSHHSSPVHAVSTHDSAQVAAALLTHALSSPPTHLVQRHHVHGVWQHGFPGQVCGEPHRQERVADDPPYAMQRNSPATPQGRVAHQLPTAAPAQEVFGVCVLRAQGIRIYVQGRN